MQNTDSDNPRLLVGLIGDQQAALVGNKCLTTGEGKNTYGTGCFMLLHTGDKHTISNHGLLTTVSIVVRKSEQQE